MCSYVIVIDKKHHTIRHIVDIDEPYNEEKFKKLYYEQYAQLEYDKFIYCSTREERDAILNKLETE